VRAEYGQRSSGRLYDDLFGAVMKRPVYGSGTDDPDPVAHKDCHGLAETGCGKERTHAGLVRNLA
jgi:hypothetical protein